MSHALRHRWFPIAASRDLPFRHVFHARLGGYEFAVWRADDGYVNVWENRCLHRGVRLSIGVNDGRELKCQYHGWRYSNRTAGCTYIPAHPADVPARTIANRTFPTVERYGLVWSGLEPEGDVPAIDALAGPAPLVLRDVAVNAPAQQVLERLKAYRFRTADRLDGDDAAVAVEDESGLSVTLAAGAGESRSPAVFFVQPVDDGQCVIRGVLDAPPDDANTLALLRHHNERLTRLRDAAEAASQAPAARAEPAFAPVEPQPAMEPEPVVAGRKAALRVVVSRKWQAAEGIAAFELAPVSGVLPTFQPGAHVDVHLPNGLVRQYSLVNGPGETAAYVVGVKREEPSAGGSHCMHDVVREGDILAISEPRNNFPLRRDAIKTLFVAGGIGITPLLAMAQTLHDLGSPYELHCFARSAAHLAFSDRLDRLGPGVVPHLGLGAEETGARLRALLSDPRPGVRLYLCGPTAMLETARRIAAELGWPEDAVHFEYFRNDTVIDQSSSFELALARSAVTLHVPAGRSMLEVMREHGINMPSSCEQGACGTCLATVIEGEPDHQDVYLSASEKRSGAKILTCVSRAKSARLVLDL